MSEITFVGLPLYEEADPEGLVVTLDNIDERLGELGVDASIVINVNGPQTAAGRLPDLGIEHSRYNAEIKILASRELGQIRAIDELVGHAALRGLERIFVTDDDIYRFPGSLQRMWEQADLPVIGARYRPFPLEVVEAEFGALPLQERLLYQVFDGDQTPQARKALRSNGFVRPAWVKGSLMLLEVDAVQGMHGQQHYAADSVMNRSIGAESMRIAEGAFFMHMGRTDMTDHIRARLRHFQGAGANTALKTFLHKEVRLPSEEMMNKVAQEIREDSPDGDFYAMLYLTRCAVREKVNQICFDIVTDQWSVDKLGPIEPMGMNQIVTYEDAKKAICRFFLDIDWDKVQDSKSGPPLPTQERHRRPVDLNTHMKIRALARAVVDSLGCMPNFFLDER
jgi:hypothetical protein